MCPEYVSNMNASESSAEHIYRRGDQSLMCANTASALAYIKSQKPACA